MAAISALELESSNRFVKFMAAKDRAERADRAKTNLPLNMDFWDFGRAPANDPLRKIRLCFGVQSSEPIRSV
jgi:hypothetical protein